MPLRSPAALARNFTLRMSSRRWALSWRAQTRLPWRGSNVEDIQRLEAFLLADGGADGHSVRSMVLQGETWHELERVAEKEKVDLIVVWHTRSNRAAQIALGSVAEAVFLHAKCPVLTLGPCAPADAPPTQKCGTCYAQWTCRRSPRMRPAYAASLARLHEAGSPSCMWWNAGRDDDR